MTKIRFINRFFPLFVKNSFFILFAGLVLLTSCEKEAHNEKGAAFYWFEYEGEDVFYENNNLEDNEYFNPIMSGFYPDPSICRKGDDYYLVNSTFSFFPGVPVFHSTDLVNWKQIGHVLDRPSQLNIVDHEISEGIFAPAISYNPNNDMFYMVTTFVGGMGNFVVKAKDPSGPWSDPVVLSEVPGIDPSIFFDDDGRAWLVHNAEPEGEPLYEGHRAIWIQEFDPQEDKMIGPRKMIIDGGHDISEEPVWVEGPHIYKVNGYYYLMAAEGGTAEDHSEVIFRSREVTGPYTTFSGNPILTQRDLSPDRSNPVTSVGHADIIQTPDGDWWAVFLGCRPYKDNHYNTGRETFLLPVIWENDWPVILEQGKHVPLIGEAGHTNVISSSEYFPSGNFMIRDNFDQEELPYHWNFIRTPEKKWYTLENETLKMDFEPVTFREKKNPAFIGRRQQHHTFSVSTAMSIIPGKVDGRAGLVCFRTEANNYFLGVSNDNGGLVAFVEKTIMRDGEPVRKRLALKKTDLKNGDKIYLKIRGDKEFIDFLISENNEDWVVLAEGQDATYLSTATAGGFVGTYIGMYASSKEE